MSTRDNWTGTQANAQVINIEKYNARYFKRSEVLAEGDSIALVTMDISFISVELGLPVIVSELPECEWYFILIKPQFEAGKGSVIKGVVRDHAVIDRVLEERSAGAVKLRLKVLDISACPIKGPKGNQEYMMVLKKT